VYAIRPETHGAFGGAFGGLIAAVALREARRAAPERTPISIDVNFLRGVPAGDARVTAEVLHAGRSMSCVGVDVRAGDRLATRVTATLVDPAAVAVDDVAAAAGAPAPPYADGRDWTVGTEGIPMVASLRPRIFTGDERGIGTGMNVPWDSDGADAEAACFAADACVGAPVGAVAAGRWAHPNPDLSLRFVAGAHAGREVVGFGRVARAVGGTAVVAIEAWSGDALLAVGTSCSLLLSR
jgi:acyl-coenzyme A thioesterase PaaI-like protein